MRCFLSHFVGFLLSFSFFLSLTDLLLGRERKSKNAAEGYGKAKVFTRFAHLFIAVDLLLVLVGVGRRGEEAGL